MEVGVNQNVGCLWDHACELCHLYYAVDAWQSTLCTFHYSYGLPLTTTRSVSVEQQVIHGYLMMIY